MIPQRMCVACRQMKDKRELVRCRVTPEKTVELDPTGKKSGRGAYICSSPECRKKARKCDLLSKALGVSAGAGTYDAIDAFWENNG